MKFLIYLTIMENGQQQFVLIVVFSRFFVPISTSSVVEIAIALSIQYAYSYISYVLSKGTRG